MTTTSVVYRRLRCTVDYEQLARHVLWLANYLRDSPDSYLGYVDVRKRGTAHMAHVPAHVALLLGMRALKRKSEGQHYVNPPATHTFITRPIVQKGEGNEPRLWCAAPPVLRLRG